MSLVLSIMIRFWKKRPRCKKKRWMSNVQMVQTSQLGQRGKGNLNMWEASRGLRKREVEVEMEMGMELLGTSMT